MEAERQEHSDRIRQVLNGNKAVYMEAVYMVRYGAL